MVSGETDEIRRMRDDVILLLMPNMNPDGTTQVANWYMAHVGTPYEKAPLPELYHRYVGHDNNRDWFMLTQPESQAVARQLYHVWFPQIVHNQHQEAPFPARIFVPPFEDPVNPHIPPLVVRGINTVGDAITRRLEQEGKVGAVSRLQFDTWWNGGMRTAPYFHNMIGILTETAHASASPATYDAAHVPAHLLDRPVDERAERVLPVALSRRPVDAARQLRVHAHRLDGRGRSRAADAARNGCTTSSRWAAIRSGPAASETFLVPAAAVGSADGRGDDQHAAPRRCGDRAGARRLRGQRADVRTPARIVIRGAQPFRAYLRDLLLPQRYPDLRLYPGGPAGPAVRHHRMDPAAADGRARRRGRSLGVGAHPAGERGGPRRPTARASTRRPCSPSTRA